MGTQTDDTIALSNDTITATVDDIIDQIPGGQEGSRLERDGEGGLDKSRVLELKQKGRDRENQLKRMHLREHRGLLQSQKHFDNIIMTQHLRKALSAGHDYTSEDGPHSDRIQWYIMQSLIKLAQSVHNRDTKALVTHLADTYNAHNGTHLKAPSYHRVWREPV